MNDEQRTAIQECINYLTPAAKDFSDLGMPGMGDSKHARCIRTLRALLASGPDAQADECGATTLYGAPCGDFCARAAAPQETPVALTIKEDERDGNWREFSVNGHGGFIRIVARMEDDEADLPLSEQVARFLLTAPRPTAPVQRTPNSGRYEFRDTGPLETGDA